VINYKFCTQCGKKNNRKSDYSYCEACGLRFYPTSYPCADVFIVDKSKVLLSIRGTNPRKGTLDIIGGFIDVYETPEQGAIREVKEETNLEVELTEVLGFYNDKYASTDKRVMITRFIGKINGGKMKAQDDVASLDWYEINKIPMDNLAFNNTREGIRDLKKWYKKRQQD
jgi:ADP-ribose pyrophosphatase YjhB (NUDIX family)